jgi:hypothetical protein
LEDIGNLSYQGILSEFEQVSILGIEFWNIIADKES